MEKMIELHQKEFGAPPAVIAEAPGVLNLMGEHTDYNEGYILQMALDRAMRVAVSPRRDNSLRFFAADYNERKRTTIPNLKYKREDRWANHPKGVIHYVQQLGLPVHGLNMTIQGDVPEGIGLGASAALCVAAALAVNAFYGSPLKTPQLIQCAAQAENDFMDKKGTLTDFFVSALAQEGRALFLDLRSLDYEYIDLDLGSNRFLITDSNVPSTLTHKDEELDERKRLCGECFGILNERRPAKSLRDYSVREIKTGTGIMPEYMRRLCTHIVEENQRVLDIKEALQNRRYDMVGKLMNRSHESLRDNYEVSCPELDWLVKRALEIDGVWGSRLTGPGFGGCTLSLLQEQVIDTYRERLQEYEHIFGFIAEILLCRPAEGGRVIFSNEKPDND